MPVEACYRFVSGCLLSMAPHEEIRLRSSAASVPPGLRLPSGELLLYLLTYFTGLPHPQLTVSVTRSYGRAYVWVYFASGKEAASLASRQWHTPPCSR